MEGTPNVAQKALLCVLSNNLRTYKDLLTFFMGLNFHETYIFGPSEKCECSCQPAKIAVADKVIQVFT